jgi:hypothetical protein
MKWYEKSTLGLVFAIIFTFFGSIIGKAQATRIITDCEVDALIPSLDAMIVTNDSIMGQLTR